MEMNEIFVSDVTVPGLSAGEITIFCENGVTRETGPVLIFQMLKTRFFSHIYIIQPFYKDLGKLLG